jgi:Ca-activated chloride channel homolog
MTNKLLYSLTFLLCLSTPVKASIFDFNLWGADSKLIKENYEEAVKDYLKIQAKDPSNQRLNYNLGIGLYRLGAFDNAAFNFQQTAQSAESPGLKERALYNLGNSLFQKEDYENAVKAYEAALQIDPNDEDTKHNIALAKKKLEQEKQDQNKDDQKQDDQNKDQDKKDQNKEKDNQNKDQDKKDQENKDDQKKDDQNKDQQNKDQQKQKPKERKGELGEQELKMLLMQVKEGQPQGNALGLKSKSNTDPKAKTKPW